LKEIVEKDGYCYLLLFSYRNDYEWMRMKETLKDFPKVSDIMEYAVSNNLVFSRYANYQLLCHPNKPDVFHLYIGARGDTALMILRILNDGDRLGGEKKSQKKEKRKNEPIMDVVLQHEKTVNTILSRKGVGFDPKKKRNILIRPDSNFITRLLKSHLFVHNGDTIRPKTESINSRNYVGHLRTKNSRDRILDSRGSLYYTCIENTTWKEIFLRYESIPEIYNSFDFIGGRKLKSLILKYRKFLIEGHLSIHETNPYYDPELRIRIPSFRIRISTNCHGECVKTDFLFNILDEDCFYV